MRLNKNDIVLFSGDSITDGNRGRSMDCNHILGHGYQFIAAAKLALDNCAEMPKFINKGYSGATMPYLLKRWQEDVIDNRPTVLSILAGVNDASSGFFDSLTPEQAAERYRDALGCAVSKTLESLPDTKIIICEPFYFPLERGDYSYKLTPHPDCEAEFKRPDTDDAEELIAYRVRATDFIRKAAKETAEKFGCTFVPLHDKLCEKISESAPNYFIWDGTHPSIAGHALIAKEWLKATENIKKGALT